MKNKWQTHIYIIFIVTILIVGSFGFPNMLPQINLLILSLTFVVLVWYAYDTNRIANQTVESNIRPIVFRTGFNIGWNFLSNNTDNSKYQECVLIEIINLKNIALDIEGYLIKDGYKYPLLFGIKEESGLESLIRFVNSRKWQWLPCNGKIVALYDSSSGEVVKSKNELKLFYRDIEGNQYLTIEDHNYIQRTIKL